MAGMWKIGKQISIELALFSKSPGECKPGLLIPIQLVSSCKQNPLSAFFTS